MRMVHIGRVYESVVAGEVGGGGREGSYIGIVGGGLLEILVRRNYQATDVRLVVKVWISKGDVK